MFFPPRQDTCFQKRPTDGVIPWRLLMQWFRGKGTPRRKMKKVHKSSGTDDKKLQTSLKKLNVQPIQAIEEVNMFKEDGNVIHFAAPKGSHSLPPEPAYSFLPFEGSNVHHYSH